MNVFSLISEDKTVHFDKMDINQKTNLTFLLLGNFLLLSVKLFDGFFFLSLYLFFSFYFTSFLILPSCIMCIIIKYKGILESKSCIVTKNSVVLNAEFCCEVSEKCYFHLFSNVTNTKIKTENTVHN